MLSRVASTLLLLLIPWIGVTILRRNRAKANGDVYRLPGPMQGLASWIWGHELAVNQLQAMEMYSAWTRIFGPVFKITGALLHPDIVIVSDNTAAQHIFGNPYTYVKSPAFRPPISNLMGEGLVWSEGETHMRQRKFMASAFTQEAVKGMASDISECAEKLVGKMTNQILAAPNKDGMQINVVDYTSSCTLDIIGRVGFGHDFKSQVTFSGQGTDDEVIRRDWKSHVEMGTTFLAFVAPILFRAMPFIAKLPIAQMQTQGAIKVMVQKIAKRLMDREKATADFMEKKRGKDRGNVLSILLRASKQVVGAGGLDDQEILDNISTLALVGHETTAGCINFCLMELARNPTMQRRLREEVTAQGNNLSYDDIQKLPYLDAVIKEALRVWPASPQTERVVLKDDVIPLSKPIKGADGQMISSLSVREGQVFHIPFMTMNTNPQVWGPDGQSFNPDRWLTSGGVPPPSELPHGWSGLSTFCDGPRNCIGWRLAVFEFKVIIANLIRSIEFSTVPGVVVHSKISPTLQPVVDGEGGVLPLQIKLV
jgi:cytochrome P450